MQSSQVEWMKRSSKYQWISSEQCSISADLMEISGVGDVVEGACSLAQIERGDKVDLYGRGRCSLLEEAQMFWCYCRREEWCRNGVPWR